MEAVQQRFVMPTLLADGSVAVRPAFAERSFLVPFVASAVPRSPWRATRSTIALAERCLP